MFVKHSKLFFLFDVYINPLFKLMTISEGCIIDACMYA